MMLRRSLLATALLAATGLATAADGPLPKNGAVPTGPLPRTVVPSEVGLHLTIDPTQARFSGHVEISVDVAKATDTIWMHGKGLNITRAVYMPQNGRNQDLTAAEVDVSGVLRLTAPRPIAAGKGTGDLRHDIVPGRPDASILAFRMASDDPSAMMPELGRSVVHDEGVQLVRDWIAKMQGDCDPGSTAVADAPSPDVASM